MADLINDLLVNGRGFSGIFVFGGVKRFLNVINRFDITKKDMPLAKNVALGFISDLSSIKIKFFNIVKTWPQHVRSKPIRMVVTIYMTPLSLHR